MRYPQPSIPFAAILTLAVLSSSCKKDEVVPDPLPSPHANTVVALQVNFTHNGAAFDPATQTITDSMGVQIRLDRMRFFISQPFFLDDNGDTVATFPDRYLLADVQNNGHIMNIGEVDGHLHTLHFGIGLDSVTNHTDPLTFTEWPLNDPTMTWGWNPAVGYQFLQIDGKYDQNNDGVVDSNDGDVSYHCGGDVLLTSTEIEVHTDANMGGDLVLVLECDLDLLMDGLSVAADPVEEVPSGLTKRLMRNVASSLTHP